MRSIRILIALAIILGWSGYSPPSTASTLHNFYGIHREVRDQATFIRLYRTHLKFNGAQLVLLYNQEYGERLGRVHDFEELLAYLGSSAFKVEWCRGTVFSYAFDDSGRFEASPRGCYQGEYVLMHRATGIPVLSLLCGNLFMPPPVVYTPPPQPRYVYAPDSYISGGCGMAALYGCHETDTVHYHWNRISPNFQQLPGYTEYRPQ